MTIPGFAARGSRGRDAPPVFRHSRRSVRAVLHLIGKGSGAAAGSADVASHRAGSRVPWQQESLSGRATVRSGPGRRSAGQRQCGVRNATGATRPGRMGGSESDSGHLLESDSLFPPSRARSTPHPAGGGVMPQYSFSAPRRFKATTSVVKASSAAQCFPSIGIELPVRATYGTCRIWEYRIRALLNFEWVMRGEG